eukprot:TRINITY_DN11430_c0_g1_i1.p1 TRINITY_DN11430_c0_g1~~TRINITY_DN11430_c0_g1_i1.p1  ORF type:complete len:217 (+),score=47.29 TRINITY_DN11430_c0_g1_i1:40-651(+)
MAVAVALCAFGSLPKYNVELTEHSPVPVLSSANPRGQGHSDCLIFNPSFIPASAGLDTEGVLVRQCCGESCAGHGLRSDRAKAERIGFAPCNLSTGLCGDVLNSSVFNLDPDADAEDPRAFLYDGFYWNFYYRSPKAPGAKCVGSQCTVRLVRTKTPLDASSWQEVGTYPWHRNGCCAMKPKGQRSYCIWGEGPDPFPAKAAI